MAKSGVTPKKFVHKQNGTPKSMKMRTNTPTPGKPKSPTGTPGKMAKGKPKFLTPKRKSAVNGGTPVKVATPRVVEPPVVTNSNKKTDKPRKEMFQNKQDRMDSSLCIRLTFPHGQLRSVDQVKKLVPSAQSIKFPNVAFAEFASETEADSMHKRLQAMVSDSQLVSVTFLGEKERQYQASSRQMNLTRLFVRGIGRATEADVRRLFPTASNITMRAKSKAHSYCFVQYLTAAACKEALEKAKGLTLFGNPLFVNFAFERPNEESTEAGVTGPTKRTLEQPKQKQPETKKSKMAVEADVDEEEDESDVDDEEDDEDEVEDEGSDKEVDDEEGDDEEEDDEDDEDEEEEDDDDDE